jgi:hypothetical protein
MAFLTSSGMGGQVGLVLRSCAPMVNLHRRDFKQTFANSDVTRPLTASSRADYWKRRPNAIPLFRMIRESTSNENMLVGLTIK